MNKQDNYIIIEISKLKNTNKQEIIDNEVENILMDNKMLKSIVTSYVNEYINDMAIWIDTDNKKERFIDYA